jgi:hypothetical protein
MHPTKLAATQSIMQDAAGHQLQPACGAISCLHRFQLGSVARPHARTHGLPTVFQMKKDKRNMAFVSVRTCCSFVSVLLIGRDSVGLRLGAM